MKFVSEIHVVQYEWAHDPDSQPSSPLTSFMYFPPSKSFSYRQPEFLPLHDLSLTQWVTQTMFGVCSYYHTNLPTSLPSLYFAPTPLPLLLFFFSPSPPIGFRFLLHQRGSRVFDRSHRAHFSASVSRVPDSLSPGQR